MLLASSDFGVRKNSRMRTLVLPHRFVGDTSTMNGEVSPGVHRPRMQHPQRQGDVGVLRQDNVAAEHTPDGVEEIGAGGRLRPRLDLPVWWVVLVVLRLHLLRNASTLPSRVPTRMPSVSARSARTRSYSAWSLRANTSISTFSSGGGAIC